MKTTCDCCDVVIVVEESTLMGAEIALCPHCAGRTTSSEGSGIVVGIYNDLEMADMEEQYRASRMPVDDIPF